MSNLREEFEKLSNIKCFINIFEFDESYNEYKYKIGKNIGDHTLGFINGGWYAFQEQQKKINAMCECMDEAIRLIDEGNSWDAKELLK